MAYSPLKAAKGARHAILTAIPAVAEIARTIATRKCVEVPPPLLFLSANRVAPPDGVLCAQPSDTETVIVPSETVKGTYVCVSGMPPAAFTSDSALRVVAAVGPADGLPPPLGHRP